MKRIAHMLTDYRNFFVGNVYLNESQRMFPTLNLTRWETYSTEQITVIVRTFYFGSLQQTKHLTARIYGGSDLGLM